MIYSNIFYINELFGGAVLDLQKKMSRKYRELQYTLLFFFLQCYYKWNYFLNFLWGCRLLVYRNETDFLHIDLIPCNFAEFITSSSYWYLTFVLVHTPCLIHINCWRCPVAGTYYGPTAPYGWALVQLSAFSLGFRTLAHSRNWTQDFSGTNSIEFPLQSLLSLTSNSPVFPHPICSHLAIIKSWAGLPHWPPILAGWRQR